DGTVSPATITAGAGISVVNAAHAVTIAATNGAVSQSTPTNPAGTASLVGVMMGLAGSFTPTRSGRALIIICGDVANSVIADGAKFQIRFGTGTAPANAAALTGTAAGALVVMTDGVAAQQMPFSVQAVVTGLTLSTAYWLDL